MNRQTKVKVAGELVRMAKELTSADGDGWDAVIKDTEENIRRTKNTLKEKGWPSGYVYNLKRSLKGLENDLVKYKQARNSSTKKTAKTNIVLINNLWDDVKYFTRRGLDSTDRQVFKLVNQTEDVITMGKIIGVPLKFWKSNDKSDFREHGLDEKFAI